MKMLLSVVIVLLFAIPAQAQHTFGYNPYSMNGIVNNATARTNGFGNYRRGYRNYNYRSRYQAPRRTYRYGGYDNPHLRSLDRWQANQTLRGIQQEMRRQTTIMETNQMFNGR